MKKNLRILNPYSVFFLLLTLAFPQSFIFSEPLLNHPGAADFQQAQTSVQEGSLDEAEDYYKKALVLEPTNPEYHFELANVYAMQHDDSEKVGDRLGADRKMQQAANELDQAVMIKPDFLPARFNLGVVYKKLGKYEDSRKQFKEVLKMDPSQVAARMQIAATYEEQGFYDEAEALYEEIRDQYPTSSEVRDALDGLENRRQQSRQQEQMQRSMHLNSLSSGLNSMRNGQPYDPSSQQQSAGIGQALPYLGQWAMQQFMKRKDGQQ